MGWRKRAAGLIAGGIVLLAIYLVLWIPFRETGSPRTLSEVNGLAIHLADMIDRPGEEHPLATDLGLDKSERLHLSERIRSAWPPEVRQKLRDGEFLLKWNAYHRSIILEFPNTKCPTGIAIGFSLSAQNEPKSLFLNDCGSSLL